MTTKEKYFSFFKIDMEDAKKRVEEKFQNCGVKCDPIYEAVEMVGEEALKRDNIFDMFFPKNIGHKKETDFRLQKKGIDFTVWDENNKPIFIDLKVCIGPDYSTIPIETVQYGKATKVRATDFFLYLTFDETKARAILVPTETYEKFLEAAPGKLDLQVSKNGTGKFFKMDYEKCKTVTWRELGKA